MAKIGKIRFVNFTYNDNRHIYDQTLDFYNGEDTLLNLQNGGGKTVLVQMMMQPIVPKQKVKDRIFKNYFMNAKAPVYIMIEWILDGNPKRILTGIGIKRILGKSLEEEGSSLKIATFLSEYEEGSDYDIKNIELTNEEKGIVKLIDFDRVMKSLSDGEKEGKDVWVFRWNSADDKKEYARRLAEYKINPDEWKNLMVKINEAEAGLTSFFNDCKTNKALIKKWFIPTVEEQLNKNGDLVENIRELIKNHAGQLVKNEDMIAEREIFEDFKRKSVDIVTSLEEHKDLLEKAEKNKSDLGGAYVFVEDNLKKLTFQKEEAFSHMKQAEDTIKGLEYQRLSGEYYGIQDDLWKLKEEEFHLSKRMNEQKGEVEQFEYRQNLLSCVKLKEELIILNARIAKFEAELEKETLEQEDIQNRMNDIRYSLKEKYQERMLRQEDVFKNEKVQLSEVKNKLAEYSEEAVLKNREISSMNDQLIRIRGRISAFYESEETLKSVYPDFNPAKNRDTGEYSKDTLNELMEELEAEETKILEDLQEIKERRIKSKEKLFLLEKECQELRAGHPALAVEKDKKESAYQLFQKEKEEIERILRSYQLDSDLLFEKEKVRIPLNTDKEKYQKLINDLNLENSIYQKQLKQYESGKAFEISDDLKKMLDDRNIFVEFGHDWLRDLPENKKAKLRLVRENPFLPYALIVSKKDFQLMKDMELNAMLSPVIPVIEREELEKAFSKKEGNHVYAVGGLHFLIPFDDRVLNKNYIKEICDEINSETAKNNAVIENAKAALEHITSDILKIESFSFTQQDADKFAEEIEEVNSRLKECSLKIAASEEEILMTRNQDMEDLSLQGNLENRKDKFNRKREDITGFIKKCGQYSQDLYDKDQKEEGLENAEAYLGEKEREIEKTKNRINDKNLKIANMASDLEKVKLQYQKYANAKQGKLIEDDIENLESKLAVYTSEVSGKIQTLQDILEDYRQQRDDKQKTIEGFGIEERLYAGMEYNAFEYEQISQEIGKTKTELNELAGAKNEIQLKAAERTSDLKYRKRNIEEQCGFLEPLERDLIKELDFEKEKSLQRNVLKNLEKDISQLKGQENKLQRVRLRLEEYRDFADGITEPQDIEGDPDKFVLQHIKEHKEYMSRMNDSKNRITAHYAEIESEFVPKAEMFKNLFHSILNNERKYQPVHALNAFNRVFMQIERKLEQHSIDMEKIDNMEQYIIDNTLSYLKNVYDEMDQIDRNSVIDLDGKRCKMLIITMPEMETLETISLREYLKATILNCVDLHKHGKSMESFLENEIDTYNLFDRYVSVNKVEITLIKIEPNKLKKKTWRQVIAENSGGELFVSAFVVFISLLTYMRGENMLRTDMESKVLIMDNPFGPITSEHLLKPLFEISKKYNTQMICLTDLKEHTIYDRFNLIYSLNIEREVGREDEYIEIKTIKKDIQTDGDEIVSASMFKIEDKSRFERA